MAIYSVEHTKRLSLRRIANGHRPYAVTSQRPRASSSLGGPRLYYPTDREREMASDRIPRITCIPSQTGSDRGRCPVVRWRDVGQEGVMAFMAPLMAENRPFLMSGYWTHQVLQKDAAQRWRTFEGIKSVLTAHGLDELSESQVYRRLRLLCACSAMSCGLWCFCVSFAKEATCAIEL